MLIYGKQVFFYVLEHHKDLINELYLAKECDKRTFARISSYGLKIRKLDFKAAQAYAKGGNHQGFLLDIKDYKFVNLGELKDEKFIIVLYGVSDVGNIGAIVRTAHALGADGLVYVGERLSMEGVVRASSGAAMDFSIALTTDIFGALNELRQKGFYLYASDSKGVSIHSLKITEGPKVLVLGGEGLGLSGRIIERCDECVGIAMKNGFDSLNVSAAFAILCDRILNG